MAFKTAIIKSNYGNCKNDFMRALEFIGGMESFVKPDEKILIKPNFLRAGKIGDAITTHPEIIKAVCLAVKNAGGIPIIGDSPGKGTVEKLIAASGLSEFIKQYNFKIADCNTPVVKKKIIGNREIKFTVFKGFDECDKIFSLAKLKTHGQMFYTGAVKNLFGLIPGALKPELHFKFSDPYKFAEMIVDLYEFAEPSLSIIDGITAMEGNGPGAGVPKNLNCLIVSENAAAADICALRIINETPQYSPIIDVCVKRKIAPKNIDGIELFGDNIEDFVDKKFKKISNPMKMTSFLPVNFFDGLLKFAVLSRPLVNQKICVKCKACVEICHSKAVSLENNRILFDYKKCIRCYCCQEICPAGAITVFKPILLRNLDFIIKHL